MPICKPSKLANFSKISQLTNQLKKKKKKLQETLFESLQLEHSDSLHLESLGCKKKKNLTKSYMK